MKTLSPAKVIICPVGGQEVIEVAEYASRPVRAQEVPLLVTWKTPAAPTYNLSDAVGSTARLPT
jgi:hypothetical protein